MTALAQYDRLEAVGRYLSEAGEISVIITFGEASLVVMDAEEMPLTHWPLATLRRRDGNGAALILTPDEGSVERLLIDDPQMIEAIRAVCEELDAARPKPPPRWRRPLIGAVCGVVAVTIGAFVLPPILADRFVETIPQAAERAMGAGMADEYAAEFSSKKLPVFCDGIAGLAALRQLEIRFQASGTTALTALKVIDAPDLSVAALPGGWIIINAGALSTLENPEALSGLLAIEVAHAEAGGPLRLTLDGMGLFGLIRVIRGVADDQELTAAFIAGHSEGYDADSRGAAVRNASQMLGDIGLPTLPMAKHLRAIGESGLADAAASADRIGSGAFDPALSDQNWVALAGICD